MSVVLFFVQITRRDEEIKWRFKCLLGIVKERLPSIPAGGTKSTRRIDKTRKGERNDFILRMLQTALMITIRVGVILTRIATNFTSLF
jgi:hypothetical protein